MPYLTERRGDEWCVIKEGDGKVMGCHASKERANAQMRALYANESQTASVENGQPPTRIEITPSSNAVEEALVASVQQISERLLATEATLLEVSQALVRVAEVASSDRTQLVEVLTAAVQTPAPEAPIVNVTVPEAVVEIPTPVINVTVPQQRPPDVNVTVEAPERTQKKVVFERDHNGAAISATLNEI